MDITVEGFHRWMFRKYKHFISHQTLFVLNIGGLSFLVPFLLVGYIFQFYNAYTLWQLAHLPTTHEWQVMVLAVIFFVLFLGNILTTLSVLREKIREKASPKASKQKYQSFRAFLSTNYHRRSQSLQQIAYRYKKPRSFTDNDIDSTSKDD